MSIPKNTWHCSVCDFYVFNTKTQCNKCLTPKPQPNTFSSYDSDFDKKICDFFQQSHLEEKSTCGRCINEGRIFNKDHMKTNHNCWKYS
jgi:hypothetical protein